MEEIKVGEYVRTKKGDIHKVIGIREELRNGKRVYGHKAYYLDSRKGSITPAFITKHSPNIIDLIEIGDLIRVVVGSHYSDGKLEEDTTVYEVAVTDVYGLGGKKLYEIGISGENGVKFIPFEDVRGVVTYEQYKGMEYEVK